VRRAIIEMESPHEVSMNSKELKEGNKFFKMKHYRIALNSHDKSLKFLCVMVLENKEDANLTEKHGISVS